MSAVQNRLHDGIMALLGLDVAGLWCSLQSFVRLRMATMNLLFVDSRHGRVVRFHDKKVRLDRDNMPVRRLRVLADQVAGGSEEYGAPRLAEAIRFQVPC
jgi:hypothetical protein